MNKEDYSALEGCISVALTVLLNGCQFGEAVKALEQAQRLIGKIEVKDELGD